MAQCKKVDIVLTIQEMSEKLCIVTIVSSLFTLKATDLEGLFVLIVIVEFLCNRHVRAIILLKCPPEIF